MPDPTTPEPRWTPETERLLIRVGYERFRNDPGADMDALYEDVAAWDEWRDDVRTYLGALADAGLLVTPQMTAVIEAARAFVNADRAMMAAGVEATPAALTATSDRIATLAAAIDALEAPRG